MNEFCSMSNENVNSTKLSQSVISFIPTPLKRQMTLLHDQIDVQYMEMNDRFWQIKASCYIVNSNNFLSKFKVTFIWFVKSSKQKKTLRSPRRVEVIDRRITLAVFWVTWLHWVHLIKKDDLKHQPFCYIDSLQPTDQKPNSVVVGKIEIKHHQSTILVNWTCRS